MRFQSKSEFPSSQVIHCNSLGRKNNSRALVYSKLNVVNNGIRTGWSPIRSEIMQGIKSDLVLYNNKEIQVDQKTVYLSKWMEKEIVFIKDLLKEDGSYLSFEEFKGKFSCKTNFIQYFQIISAIESKTNRVS